MTGEGWRVSRAPPMRHIQEGCPPLTTPQLPVTAPNLSRKLLAETRKLSGSQVVAVTISSGLERSVARGPHRGAAGSGAAGLPHGTQDGGGRACLGRGSPRSAAYLGHWLATSLRR